MSRFELEEVIPGRLARGWDLHFRRLVAVKFLPDGLTSQGSGGRLLAAWEQWYEARHAGLLHPAQLDFQGNRLVREWACGFTLLELLRQRRQLSGAETLVLIEAAAATMDHAAAHGLLAEGALDKWFVCFGEGNGEVAGSAAAGKPMAGWPRWCLKLDPLRLADLVPAGHDRTARHLSVAPGHLSPAVEGALQFVRELSGGSGLRREAPLSALGDQGNRVLAWARENRFGTALEFAQILRKGMPDALPGAGAVAAAAPRPYTLRSVPGGGAAASGECLFLEPADVASRPLQLIHRDEFRVGRSSTEADLTLRFSERPAPGDDLTMGLSRVQARLCREGDEIRLRDGTGAAPSSNGTFTREGPLHPVAGVALRQVRLVQFGAHWRGTLLPMRASPERGLPGEERPPSAAEAPAGLPPATEEPWGALFVVPSHGCAVRVETVWLLKEAGFGVALTGSLIWDTEGVGAAPAGFWVNRGRFYLLNRRLGDEELSLDLQGLEPGRFSPLAGGMQLRIGQGAWRIRIA